jgi:tetratricopeptide (TPR) repeat protein
MRGYLAEGRERTERALGMAHAPDHPDARIKALEAAGGLCYWQNDGPASERWYQEALNLARAAGDLAGEANALYNLTFGTIYLLAREGDLPPDARGAGRRYALEALEIYRRLGDRPGEARALWAISNTYYDERATKEGADYAAEALAVFREVGDVFMIGWAQYTLSLYYLQVGDLPTATDMLEEALGIFNEASDVTGYVLVLDAIAFLAHTVGDVKTAAELSGAVAELEQRSGTGLTAPNRSNVGWDPKALGTDAETQAAFSAGRRLSADEAVSRAIDWLRAHRTTPAAGP